MASRYVAKYTIPEGLAEILHDISSNIIED